MIKVQFDDIVYKLQAFGGASVYWREMTARVMKDSRFQAFRNQPSRYLRCIPTYSSADIFHSSHFRVSPLGKAKNVSTVHDLNYELGYVQAGVSSKLNTLERKCSYFTADALICISLSTKQELLEVYPELARRCPIYVIHHGFSDFNQIRPQEPERQLTYPYVLYVGARKGYKCFTDALSGFYLSNIWREGVKLVCTGADFEVDELSMIDEYGLSDAVVFAGNVHQSCLSSLYRQAHCLLYSSVHEGFGLPLLEAMNYDCPVIACNTSCIPEIIGEAGILVQPHAVEEISKAIIALQDGLFRLKKIEMGRKQAGLFSWEKSAQAHMNVYEDILGQ